MLLHFSQLREEKNPLFLMVMQGGRSAVGAEHFRVFSALNIH